MDWTTIAVIGAVLVVFVGLRQLGLARVESARHQLRQGAKVIDVRSSAEFQSGHLPRAVNIPLGDLKEQIAEQVPDKESALLLHCLSGTRSALAKRILRKLGYPNAHNLGSYRRAERIVSAH